MVHSFFLADVKHPILGTDFFRQNNLLIDINGKRLVRDGGSGRLPAGCVVIPAKPAIFSPWIFGLRSCTTTLEAVFASFPSFTASHGKAEPVLSFATKFISEIDQNCLLITNFDVLNFPMGSLRDITYFCLILPVFYLFFEFLAIFDQL